MLTRLQPADHVEGQAAGPVEHDDAGREVQIALKEPVGPPILRIVREPIVDRECAAVDAQADAMAAENQGL